MIQLEVKHAASQSLTPTDNKLAQLARHLIPMSLLEIPGGSNLVLSQDQLLVKELEAFQDLGAELAQHGFVKHQGIEIVIRSTEHFSPDRVLHHCVAVRVP
jgi:hypothetical protein